MWRTPHLERIHIMLEAFTLGIERRIHAPHTLGQHGWIVDPLGARDYLLAAHEGIVGVGQGGVGWIEVGVERSSSDGVVSKNVEICIVLFEDEPAKGFFICCAGTDALALWLIT